MAEWKKEASVKILVKQVLLGRKRFNELANITKFKWRFDRRSGNCNSSNYKLTLKKIGDFNGIHVLKEINCQRETPRKNDNVAEKSIMKAKWVRKNCSKSFKWEISVEPVHHALLNWQSQKGTLNIHC